APEARSAAASAPTRRPPSRTGARGRPAKSSHSPGTACRWRWAPDLECLGIVRSAARAGAARAGERRSVVEGEAEEGVALAAAAADGRILRAALRGGTRGLRARP